MIPIPGVRGGVVHVHRAHAEAAVEAAHRVDAAADDRYAAAAAPTRHLGEVQPALFFEVVALNRPDIQLFMNN